MMHDLTERKEVEQALRESEERFRILFEHSPDGILLIDPHDANVFWPIIACNEVMARMNGYTREELLGRSIALLDPKHLEPGHSAAHLERLRREGTIQDEAVHCRKDGTCFPIEFSTSLVTLAGRELVLGIDRDITERKRTEEALQQARDELERRVEQRTAELSTANQRLQESIVELQQAQVDNARLYQEAQQALGARDQFLSIAAHELKTPITSIVGYAQMLQRRAERGDMDGTRYLRALHTLSEQALRLDRLIRSLLDISRIQVGHLTLEHEPVDLAQLVRRIVEETQPTLEHHTLTCRSPDEPLVVDGDALRLEQVVQNLIQNAIKYSPDGGGVDVEVERRGEDACIIVSDQGIGIPEAALPQLFTRFYRAANVTATHITGVGVGLYVVNEIVTLHGGRVEVESTEGAGSSFRVYLPLALSEF